MQETIAYGTLMMTVGLERILAKPIDAERRLVAIFAADVEGYSRLMGADEVSTLRDLTERRALKVTRLTRTGHRYRSRAAGGRRKS